MNNTTRLLERVRERCDPPSKNQVAKTCNIPRSSINGMYAGKRYPNALQALEISRFLRMDLGHVLSYIAEDKARSDETRAAARRRAPRLHSAAGFAFATAVMLITSGYNKATASEEFSMGFVEQPIHYAQLLKLDRVDRADDDTPTLIIFWMWCQAASKCRQQPDRQSGSSHKKGLPDWEALKVQPLRGGRTD